MDIFSCTDETVLREHTSGMFIVQTSKRGTQGQSEDGRNGAYGNRQKSWQLSDWESVPILHR